MLIGGEREREREQLEAGAAHFIAFGWVGESSGRMWGHARMMNII